MPEHPTRGPAPPPAQVRFPHGLLEFTQGGCAPGATANLTSTCSQGLPASIVGNTATSSIAVGRQVVVAQATNGTIVEQGGPGSSVVTAIPTPSEWSLLPGLLLAGPAAAKPGRRCGRTSAPMSCPVRERAGRRWQTRDSARIRVILPDPGLEPTCHRSANCDSPTS